VENIEGAPGLIWRGGFPLPQSTKGSGERRKFPWWVWGEMKRILGVGHQKCVKWATRKPCYRRDNWAMPL